jgi:hypothetical protein
VKIEPALAMVQSLGQKAVYRASELFEPAGSKATAYRVIRRLQELGLAAETKRRGYFTVRSSAFQPYQVWPHLLPSLLALRQARHFGRSYDESDVNNARRLLSGMVTLDYRAYELTKLQTPHTFFVYVSDQNRVAELLRSKGFSEGSKGRVAILPRGQDERDFENEIQRVHLDCLAFGGRSTLDAIAIELLYGDRLSVRGEFPVDIVLKVREELPR